MRVIVRFLPARVAVIAMVMTGMRIVDLIFVNVIGLRGHPADRLRYRESHPGERIANGLLGAVLNSVKLRVVHGWAQQGDRDASAVLAQVQEMVTPEPARRPQPVLFPDPFTLTYQMFESLFRIGWSMTVPGPWGLMHTSFVIR